MTAPVGPLVSEAAQLLDVLAGRLEQARDRWRAPSSGSEGAGASDGHGGGEPGADADANADANADADADADEDAESAAAGDESAGDGDPGGAAAGDGAPDTAAGDGSGRAGRCPQCGHDPAAASCTGCPLCATVALLRGERPESAARLVDGALTIVQALRALLAGNSGSDGPGSGDTHTPAGPGSAPAPRAGDAGPGLIRIDVG